MNKIIEIATEPKFLILIQATEADTKTNILHNELQEFIENEDEFDEEENDIDEEENDHDQKEDDFDQNVERLKECNKGLPVSDLLHLLKSMKRKLLSNSSDIDFNIEKEIFKESPYYHKIIESANSPDTMKDNLVLMIFNTDNLIFFSEKNGFQFFVYVFIAVLMISIIQSKKLSIDSRISLCRIRYNRVKNLQLHRYKRQKSRSNTLSRSSLLKNFDEFQIERLLLGSSSVISFVDSSSLVGSSFT